MMRRSINVAGDPRTREHRLLIAVAMAAAVSTVVAMVAPLRASGAEDDRLTEARRRVTATQGAADAATARYADAQSLHARIVGDIADLEAAIGDGRARAAVLRATARQRAVAAYKTAGGSAPLPGLEGDEPLRAARRQKLLDDANALDLDAVDELARVEEDLDAKRRELESRRSEAEEALVAMRAEAARVEADLAAAQRAQVDVEEQLRREEALRREAERQARERPAPAPRPSAGGASSGDGPSSGGGPSSIGIICPIRGAVSFVDSWHAPRHQGPHLGVDLMSPRGTPNVAVVSGQAEMRGGGISGNGVRLHGDDGNLYYYFHLDGYEGGSRHVAQGEVVGYTGNTGDASGGPTHTHFEIHPGGGAAVNPYPYVRPVC